MLVGVPKETKDNEFRVAVIPATVEELVRRGHRVLVEAGPGGGAGLADALDLPCVPASEALKR